MVHRLFLRCGAPVRDYPTLYTFPRSMQCRCTYLSMIVYGNNTSILLEWPRSLASCSWRAVLLLLEDDAAAGAGVPNLHLLHRLFFNMHTEHLSFFGAPNFDAIVRFFVDKAGGKSQKKGRGEVAINVHTSLPGGGMCGRRRGEDRMNFSEFSHLKHQQI